MPKRRLCALYIEIDEGRVKLATTTIRKNKYIDQTMKRRGRRRPLSYREYYYIRDIVGIRYSVYNVYNIST